MTVYSAHHMRIHETPELKDIPSHVKDHPSDLIPQIRVYEVAPGTSLFWECVVTDPKTATVSFWYEAAVGDDGGVRITYSSRNEDLDQPDEGWFVEVRTASEQWDLHKSQSMISDAIKLHEALGNHLRFNFR
jgi:hypothetical protein